MILGKRERQILAEIETIEAYIKELTVKRDLLQAQLLGSRSIDMGISDVNRKNSAIRIMVESIVVDALKTSNGALRSAELLEISRKIDHDLKGSTFRTYLHRMKVKGIICQADRVGYWRLYPQFKPRLKVIDDF